MSFTCTGTPTCLPILTQVVYDYCYQEEAFTLTVTSACPDKKVPANPSCDVTVTCSLASSIPAATANYVLTTWVYSGTVTLTWTCDSSTKSQEIPFEFFKQNVLLCAPTNTTPVCEATVLQYPPAVVGNTILVQIQICLTFEVLANAKLLVQTFGELFPSECQTGGLLPCPIGPMPLPCDP